VQPSLAVVGCGVENRFGHPHPEVLRRYAGVRVLRTDVHGTVQLDERGVRVWRPGDGWRWW
jgi:competence protein ComEC